MSKQRQFYDFCFTINNYTQHDERYLSNAYKDGVASYVIYGKEIGEQGTNHLQGFIQFNRATSLSMAKHYLPRAHLEPRKGTVKEAIIYCRKEGDVIEYGESTRQGYRSDLTEVTNLISKGFSIEHVAKRCNVQYVKYHKGIEKLRNMYIQDRTECANVEVFYGESGCGKTRRAINKFIGKDFYKWDPQCGQWFDGYTGQKYVIFDEFRGQLPFGMLLSLLDRYTCNVQYKGGMIKFVATHIIITSPTHPQDWYNLDDKEGKYNQLMRRITAIYNLSEQDEDPRDETCIPDHFKDLEYWQETEYDKSPRDIFSLN